MRVLIVGAAGVIGSALAERFLQMGLGVTCMDICRIDEAWRLNGVKDKISYVWKASNDMVLDDARGIDIVIDGGIGVADRPLGTASPSYTFAANLAPSLRILEVLSRMDSKPTVIYPSSFNTLYGHPSGSVYSAKMLPSPTSLYGWTKAAAELLYMAYNKAHGVPCIITRVGSGYGARMRSDEFPARVMLNALLQKKTVVRSPQAKRLWTYGEDIVDFYAKLISSAGQYVGQTLHCAGNADNKIVANIDLAKMIISLSGSQTDIVAGEYEPGEIIDGKPISFEIDSQSPLWSPKFTLEQGMKKTLGWFKDNLFRYS